jgi:hypothetical protein
MSLVEFGDAGGRGGPCLAPARMARLSPLLVRSAARCDPPSPEGGGARASDRPRLARRDPNDQRRRRLAMKRGHEARPAPPPGVTEFHETH